MKLLLDESMLRRLGACFSISFEIQTVPGMGWAGRSNGDLLRLDADQVFDVTADHGIEYHQNLSSLSLPVIVLMASRTQVRKLRRFVTQVVELINEDLQRRVYRVVDWSASPSRRGTSEPVVPGIRSLSRISSSGRTSSTRTTNGLAAR